ncbi:hypothetical protein [Caldimonas brevitalea]|uniref:Uncharacterized protein n=1 Tax=Caldimonas brevitalea TaxID=413882 RepID=A0A0G3BH96_9BURK|nr:hypothetical protein [Caldimonas brevitalea]AKJ28769.1 hypothetical protein AAW51_2078 [Caldimonas brevitalea]
MGLMSEPLTEHELQAETDRWLRQLNTTDVLDELCDAEGPLTLAIEAGNARAIGEIVLEVRQAYAKRLACRELCAFGAQLPTTEQVASLALIRASAGQ